MLLSQTWGDLDLEFISCGSKVASGEHFPRGKKRTHPKSLIPDFCPVKLSELTARLFAWLGLATESKVPLIVDLEALRIRGCCFFP